MQNREAMIPLTRACQRSRFVARHESMSLVVSWELLLEEVEPIPGCVPAGTGTSGS